MSASDLWSVHRALAVLAGEWPELASGEQPSCEQLDAWLGGVTSNWRVVRATQAHSSYEQAVMEGVIPTREGSWHDVFNVLAFARFPRSKAALHRRVGELQVARRAAALARGSRANDRGREEDALALIDECALVLAGSAEGIAAYEAVQAGAIEGVDRVVREYGIRVRVLGHALHEHLVLGREAIRTMVVTVVCEGVVEWGRVDAVLGGRIAAGGFPVPQREARLPWAHSLVDSWVE